MISKWLSLFSIYRTLSIKCHKKSYNVPLPNKQIRLNRKQIGASETNHKQTIKLTVGQLQLTELLQAQYAAKKVVHSYKHR